MLFTASSDQKKPAVNRFYLVLFWSFFWGIAAHGMALFNKFIYHDEAECFNNVGTTYGSGRWMLGIMESFMNRFTQSRRYSFSVLNGLITIMCVAAILYLLFTMLDIQDHLMSILVIGIFVTFPAITGIFGYMFTAPYYYFGTLMGAFGIFLYHRYHNIPSFVLCMILIACSVGTYQANLPVCICILMLSFAHNCTHGDNDRSAIIKKAAAVAALCAGSLALYLILNRVFLAITKTRLLNYKGISGDDTGIFVYVSRILDAYRDFFFPDPNHAGNVFLFSARYFHLALILVCLIPTVLLLIRTFQKNRLNGCILTVFIAFFPLAAYLINVISPSSDIQNRMTFGKAFTFLLAAWLWENTVLKRKAVINIRKVTLCLMAFILFMNIRYANLCYMKANVLQSQAYSYYTNLVDRIISLDEYTPDTPVVYINEYKKDYAVVTGTQQWFEPVKSFPYIYTSIINSGTWKETMAFLCGFDPVVRSSDEFENMSVVKAMPCYPHQGSIRYIDGCIIVKFK